jgi:hypothetical protein
MTSATPTNAEEQKPVKTEREFEATIITALEISPYDLKALKHYLLLAKWIPVSTDEAAITDAVLKLRQFYEYNHNHVWAFSDNVRLQRLFEARGTGWIEDWESDFGLTGRAPKATYDLEVRRKTIKYNAVRDLFMHMAVSEASERDKAAKPS